LGVVSTRRGVGQMFLVGEDERRGICVSVQGAASQSTPVPYAVVAQRERSGGWF